MSPFSTDLFTVAPAAVELLGIDLDRIPMPNSVYIYVHPQILADLQRQDLLQLRPGRKHPYPRELYQKLRIGSEIIRSRKPLVELRRIVTKKSTSRFFSMSRPQKCGSWARDQARYSDNVGSTRRSVL